MKAVSVKILKICYENTFLLLFLCSAVVASWLLLQAAETCLYVFFLFMQTTSFNLHKMIYAPIVQIYDLQLDNILEVYSAFGALQMHNVAMDQIRGFFFKTF